MQDVNAVLDSPVLSFLSTSGTSVSAVTVNASDSLASLVELLVVSRVHRAHVVDSKRRPVGIVTMMNVIRLLLSSEINVHG